MVDETSGIVAYDSSGNGHDGNLTNGPTWTTGKIGGALSFDGFDDPGTLGNVTGGLLDLTLNSLEVKTNDQFDLNQRFGKAITNPWRRLLVLVLENTSLV